MATGETDSGEGAENRPEVEVEKKLPGDDRRGAGHKFKRLPHLCPPSRIPGILPPFFLDFNPVVRLNTPGLRWQDVYFGREKKFVVEDNRQMNFL